MWEIYLDPCINKTVRHNFTHTHTHANCNHSPTVSGCAKPNVCGTFPQLWTKYHVKCVNFLREFGKFVCVCVCVDFLTSNTSSSRMRVPNTTMPLVSMIGFGLRANLRVVCFLQSTISVTLCLWTLIATRCHLQTHTNTSTYKNSRIRVTF